MNRTTTPGAAPVNDIVETVFDSIAEAGAELVDPVAIPDVTEQIKETTVSASPTANFGRIIPGYRQSSYRRDGRVGGPLSDDQIEPNTELGVEPLTWVHYQELDHPRWMGLNWTEWQLIPEAQAEASTDNGLYRIKTSTDELLTYIGQSGNLRSRLRAHTKTYSEDHKIQFTVCPELDARHKREEIETELIGAHYLLTGEPPRNQF